MGLITFLSDFGTQDHYVAAVRAAVWNINPTLRVTDIAHNIPCANILQAAFVLNACFRDHPKGTVHIVSVGADTTGQDPGLIIQMEGHLFVCPNNGILSLMTQEKPEIALALSAIPHTAGTFVARNRYAPAAAMLASGQSPYELGKPIENIYKCLNPTFTPSKNQIRGQIIHIDQQGNLITSILKQQFQEWVKEQPKFEVIFGSERINTIHKHYADVEEGDPFCLFNDIHRLEIGIRLGNAHQLLGLGCRTPVLIQATSKS